MSISIGLFISHLMVEPCQLKLVMSNLTRKFSITILRKNHMSDGKGKTHSVSMNRKIKI